MFDNNNNVDKNSFVFLFNEDIYIIPEKVQVSKEPLREVAGKEVAAKQELPKVENKPEPVEKKIPSIPKIPTVTLSDYAILLSSQKELDAGREFLGKILGAIKVDLNKTDIYTDKATEAILEKSEHKYILSFGLDAAKHQQSYNKLNSAGKSIYLFSYNLSELQADVEKKKALWGALQQLLK